MRRDDLTDAEWERVASLLPQDGVHADRTTDDRTVIDGLLHQARTGVRWRHLPDRYGCWVTLYKRHRRWLADGTWHRLTLALRTTDDDTRDDTARDGSGDRRAAPAPLDLIRTHHTGPPGLPPPRAPVKDSAVLAGLQALLGGTARPRGHRH